MQDQILPSIRPYQDPELIQLIVKRMKRQLSNWELKKEAMNSGIIFQVQGLIIQMKGIVKMLLQVGSIFRIKGLELVHQNDLIFPNSILVQDLLHTISLARLVKVLNI